MAGKGDKWRKDFDFKKYWDNWEEITKSDKPDHSDKKILNHGKVKYIYR